MSSTPASSTATSAQAPVNLGHVLKNPRHKTSKASSGTYALKEKEFQAAYRTPRKGKKRPCCPSSLSVNKIAATVTTPVSACSAKKHRPQKTEPMTPAYITAVFANTPLPLADMNTWTTHDDVRLRQCLQNCHSSGPFGKCDWKKVYQSFEGKYRQTSLSTRWTQLREAHDKSSQAS
jgi:hypothetical protein